MQGLAGTARPHSSSSSSGGLCSSSKSSSSPSSHHRLVLFSLKIDVDAFNAGGRGRGNGLVRSKSVRGGLRWKSGSFRFFSTLHNFLSRRHCRCRHRRRRSVVDATLAELLRQVRFHHIIQVQSSSSHECPRLKLRARLCQLMGPGRAFQISF